MYTLAARADVLECPELVLPLPPLFLPLQQAAGLAAPEEHLRELCNDASDLFSVAGADELYAAFYSPLQV